jgi:hypothetical protein
MNANELRNHAAELRKQVGTSCRSQEEVASQLSIANLELAAALIDTHAPKTCKAKKASKKRR